MQKRYRIEADKNAVSPVFLAKLVSRMNGGTVVTVDDYAGSINIKNPCLGEAALSRIMVETGWRFLGSAEMSLAA